VTLTVHTEGCHLELPVRPPDPRDAELPAFAAPECAAHEPWRSLGESAFRRRADVEPGSGDHIAGMRSGYDADGRVVLGRHDALGLEGGDGSEIETRIHPSDPLRARAAMRQRTVLRRDTWSASVESEVEVSCTRDHFRVQARLAASDGERSVFERRWDERVPRLGV